MRSDEVSEVSGQVFQVVLQAHVGVALQQVVQLGDGALELVSASELVDDTLHLPVDRLLLTRVLGWCSG